MEISLILAAYPAIDASPFVGFAFQAFASTETLLFVVSDMFISLRCHQLPRLRCQCLLPECRQKFKVAWSSALKVNGNYHLAFVIRGVLLQPHLGGFI